VDWGFRISGLYGLDYRFTTSNGFLSNQLLGKNQENGFDAPMFYFDLYVPQVAQGMDIRVGRYISLPDIEAQLAPNNYTYSHSLTYTFDCYTQLGLNATIKLSNHWMVQAGVSPGCDTMPWTSSAKVTLNACLGYTWSEGRDNFYACDNSLNDGHYAYNNLQAFYATWYHKYGKDSRWHSATESWYQYEKDTPNVNNPAAQSLLITGANGAICNNIEAVTCLAPDYAIVNYQEYQASKHDYFRSATNSSTISWASGPEPSRNSPSISWAGATGWEPRSFSAPSSAGSTPTTRRRTTTARGTVSSRSPAT
jgi:hypothetical protein